MSAELGPGIKNSKCYHNRTQNSGDYDQRT